MSDVEDSSLPLYDFRCTAGHTREVRLPFGSPSEMPCERCGKPAKRQLHARPIMFKGSGWYSTDSRGTSSATRTDKSSFASEDGVSTETKTIKSEPAKAKKPAAKNGDRPASAD